jgi:hypothetical protein
VDRLKIPCRCLNTEHEFGSESCVLESPQYDCYVTTNYNVYVLVIDAIHMLWESLSRPLSEEDRVSVETILCELPNLAEAVLMAISERQPYMVARVGKPSEYRTMVIPMPGGKPN